MTGTERNKAHGQKQLLQLEYKLLIRTQLFFGYSGVIDYQGVEVERRGQGGKGCAEQQSGDTTHTSGIHSRPSCAHRAPFRKVFLASASLASESLACLPEFIG